MSATARCKYWWDENVKYGLSVSVEPTEEPVSVAEARNHCRIYITDDDGWLGNSIIAARRLCETFIKRCFVTTTLRLTLDAMPGWEFYLPRPRLIAVSTLKHRDSANVLQTISSALYSVDTYTEPGRITPIYQGSWPSSQLTHTNAVEVIYTAGYGAASAVPANIKLAIMAAVQAWNHNREGELTLPAASKSLLRAESWGYLP